MKIAFAIFLFGMFLSNPVLAAIPPVSQGQVAPSQPAPITLTPTEAVRILQSRNKDPLQIFPALAVASLDPATRPVVYAYLDGPSQSKAMTDYWTNTHNPDNGRMSQLEYDLCRFFAQGRDPVYFDLFAHFVSSWFSSISGNEEKHVRQFARGLPPNSPLQSLFLDYLQNAIFKHKPEFGRDGLSLMAMDNCDAAYARIDQIISSDVFWQLPDAESNVVDFLFYTEDINCLDARVLPIYYNLLQRAPHVTAKSGQTYSKEGLLHCLFNGGFVSSEPSPMDHGRPQLQEVDPTSYPLFLEMLDYSANANLNPNVVGLKEEIAETKAQILVWQKDPSTRPPINKADVLRRSLTYDDRYLSLLGPPPIIQISILPNPPVPVTEFIAQAVPPASAQTSTSPKPSSSKPIPAVAQADAAPLSTPIFIALSIIVVAGIFWRIRRK